MLVESDMTQTVEKAVIDIAALVAAGTAQKARSRGGSGESSRTSQVKLLGYDGLEFIHNSMKNNAVKARDLAVIGSEWFRKETVDLVLSKKAESAKTFSKVIVTDMDLKFGDEIVRLSDILAVAESDEQVQQLLNVAVFGEVYITNEHFACEWPLGEAVKSFEGDPKATELAPILAPWSLLIDALSQYADKQ